MPTPSTVECTFSEDTKQQIQSAIEQILLPLNANGANLQPNASMRLASRLDLSPSGLAALAERDAAFLAAGANAMSDFEIAFNAAGVVLIVKEPAVAELKGGAAITASGLALAGVVAGAIPVVGLGITAICEIFAALVGIYAGAIEMADKGKGVYITVTWVQLALAIPFFWCWTTICLPVIGAIE